MFILINMLSFFLDYHFNFIIDLLELLFSTYYYLHCCATIITFIFTFNHKLILFKKLNLFIKLRLKFLNIIIQLF